MKEAGRTFLYFILIATICCSAHYALLSFLDLKEVKRELYLPSTYGLFFLGSLLVLLVVHIVYQKDKDIVGLSFLVATMVKFFVAGILAKTLLTDDGDSRLAQFHFIGLFLLFLAIETVLTIRILNKKQ